MERISGPYKGYFIAAYTVGDGQIFAGYAKICLAEPASVWNAESVEKLTTATGYRTEQEALSAAEQKARQVVVELVGNLDPITSPGALS